MDHLQTEARNPASTNLDELTALELVRLMSAEDARVVPAVASQAEAIALAVEVIAERLRGGGRLVYAGAGTSGRLGVLDATECPPTFNAPPGQVVGLIAGGPAALTRAAEGAEDRPELAEQDLKAIAFGAGDVLVGIATSGRTPYVGGALAHARGLGAFTVGLFCNADADLLPLVDVAIAPVVGAEVLTGSTRLKAGTATKLVLNMLSTGAMVRLGKVYGNLLVDLRATNSKLRARVNRIVRTLTGLSKEEAGGLLARCGGELKTALVAHLAGVAPEEARARLEQAGGQVRPALGRPPNDPASRPPNHPTAYLGVDGGGSHTVALLAAADGSVLGRGEGGPSNLQAVGPEGALRALDEAVSAAFGAAGLRRGPVASACLGLAGAGREEDRRLVRDWAGRVGLAGRVDVRSDAALLLAAGTLDGWGLAVVAGTGSIAFGQAPDGGTARAGGWGYLLGDEGSGSALALAALRAAVRAGDGRGPPTALLPRFLERLGLAQAQDLVGCLYGGGWDRAALAALAPLVLATAEVGDGVAGGLVDDAARELAVAAAAVVRRLALDPAGVPVALAGGLLVGSDGYRQRLLGSLKEMGVVPGAVALVAEPARGAVRVARAAPAVPPE